MWLEINIPIPCWLTLCDKDILKAAGISLFRFSSYSLDTLFANFLSLTYSSYRHCVKSVRIRSCSGPHFPIFGLNMERYGVSLRIQSEYRKMQTRVTPNTDTFYTVGYWTNLSKRSSQISGQILFNKNRQSLTTSNGINMKLRPS